MYLMYRLQFFSHYDETITWDFMIEVNKTAVTFKGFAAWKKNLHM